MPNVFPTLKVRPSSRLMIISPVDECTPAVNCLALSRNLDLDSGAIKAVHLLIPELSRLQAHLSTIGNLHARQDGGIPTASLPVDSPNAPLEPHLQASDAEVGLSIDTP